MYLLCVFYVSILYEYYQYSYQTFIEDYSRLGYFQRDSPARAFLKYFTWVFFNKIFEMTF